jgi:hypothetical protein
MTEIPARRPYANTLTSSKNKNVGSFQVASVTLIESHQSSLTRGSSRWRNVPLSW